MIRMEGLKVKDSHLIEKHSLISVVPSVLLVVFLAGCFRDTRSQYPVFDPEYAAEVFCDCMNREWGNRSHGENWDFCYHETRMYSHYFDLHVDSMMVGGSRHILGNESPGDYFLLWLDLTKECGDNVKPSKFDTIPASRRDGNNY